MASKYIKREEIESNAIIGFVESKRTKNEFCGKRVYEPQEISMLGEYSYIIVLVLYESRNILDICKKNSIPYEKLVLLDNYEWATGESMRKSPKLVREISSQYVIEEIERKMPLLYTQMKEIQIQASRYIVVSRNGFDLVEEDDPLQSEDFASKEYQTDYYRYRTFELVANEIIDNSINGSVAEVGVFRGFFSKLINKKFPNKSLYLFDTFESFDEEEFNEEVLAGRCTEDFYAAFLDTNEDKVLDIMPNREKCIIVKGLFPESAKGLEQEMFAFVSIDVDFEKSILEGLRFFYPKMNTGGIIFVHDYNNRFLEGVKKAVAKYESEIKKGLCKVPIADEGGTLVIVKY